jgi:hypothetical protein
VGVSSRGAPVTPVTPEYPASDLLRSAGGLPVRHIMCTTNVRPCHRLLVESWGGPQRRPGTKVQHADCDLIPGVGQA